MSYSEIIPVLINALQEQQKIITDLKTQVDSLQTLNKNETNQIKAELSEIKRMLNLEAERK
jgi:hypothetical protein